MNEKLSCEVGTVTGFEFSSTVELKLRSSKHKKVINIMQWLNQNYYISSASKKRQGVFIRFRLVTGSWSKQAFKVVLKAYLFHELQWLKLY